MSDQPLVSVITATFNMGGYVSEAVESVLAQDYPHVQSIIVDDGSTDDTQKVLERFHGDSRVSVIHQTNAGQTVAKNRGIAAARGQLIGFCDADDRWLPHKLRRQVPEMMARPDVGVVYSDRYVIDAEGNRVPSDGPERHSGRVTAKLLVENFLPFPTVLVRRDTLEKAGGFDEDLSMSIDCDLWLRISLSSEFLYIPEPLVEYRVWGGQMSHRMDERMDDFFRLMERFLREHPGAVSGAEARRAYAHSHTTRGIWLASVGRRQEAWKDYLRALTYRPIDVRLWKCVIRLALGRWKRAA